MITDIKQIYKIMLPEERRGLLLLAALVMVMATMELLTIAMLGSVFSAAADSGAIENNFITRFFVGVLSFESMSDFVLAFASIALLQLCFSTGFSLYTYRILARYSAYLGVGFSDRLYSLYLAKGWLYHASENSATLIRKLTIEVERVSVSVIQPILQLGARLFLVVLIALGLFFYNPVVSSLIAVCYAGSYLLIYRVVRSRLSRNGEVISRVYDRRMRLMNLGFIGIKDVIITQKREVLASEFSNVGQPLITAKAENMILGFTPRYFLEFVTFGGMIGSVIVVITVGGASLTALLPVFAFYAFSAFKLLPALQQSYYYLTQFRSNYAAFESIEDDLAEAESIRGLKPAEHILKYESEIQFENLSFTYPTREEAALDGVSLRISKNSKVGLVGASGSGKSTFVDCLMGLVKANDGRVLVDGIELTEANLGAWYDQISYVPQTISLFDGTIMENVAFGEKADEVDVTRVKRAVSQSGLDSVVASLDDGLDTNVGDRGVKFSGGQRQRIGIARALYKDTNILVFDEATSALDGVSEHLIMESVESLSGQKTIIMVAHRLRTVKDCDQIFVFDKGRVVASGTYSELASNSEDFSKLLEYA